MDELTLHVKLNAKNTDLMGYTTYVFENLEYTEYENKYLMCVRFPNWESAPIEIDDRGYVSVRFVQEGVSQWYDGEKMNVYKYTNIVFLKFIKELENKEFLID